MRNQREDVLEITFTTDGEISPRFKLVFDFAEYLRILLEY